MQNSEAVTHRVGWHVNPWCEAVGISRASWYNLPPELQPASVRLVGRRIIIESPSDYLKRLAATDRQAA